MDYKVGKAGFVNIKIEFIYSYTIDKDNTREYSLRNFYFNFREER